MSLDHEKCPHQCGHDVCELVVGSLRGENAALKGALGHIRKDFFRLAMIAYERGVGEHEIRAIAEGREP